MAEWSEDQEMPLPGSLWLQGHVHQHVVRPPPALLISHGRQNISRLSVPSPDADIID